MGAGDSWRCRRHRTRRSHADKEAAYRARAQRRAGRGPARCCRRGGSSLDAVEATIRVLEDDPLFNAGRGAVFTADGRNELDASIMDGATRKAGAVAGVTRTRNPISLARAVMEKSPHVMLAREGADQFSVEQGLPQVDPGYFRTEQRWQQLLDWRRDNAEAARSHAFARHRRRGGHRRQWPRGRGHVHGRHDRQALGTRRRFAGDRRGHLCRGWQPARCPPRARANIFIRASAARQLCDRIAWRGEAVQAAAAATIADIGDIGGDGGVIAMDGTGNIAFAMNSSGMYRGWVTSALPAATAIYSNERARASAR